MFICGYTFVQCICVRAIWSRSRKKQRERALREREEESV